MPAIRFSITILQFFAKSRVKPGEDKESHDCGNKNHVIHIFFAPCFRRLVIHMSYSRQHLRPGSLRAIVNLRPKRIKNA